MLSGIIGALIGQRLAPADALELAVVVERRRPRLVAEDAEALNCTSELMNLRRIADRGTSAHRQIRGYEAALILRSAGFGRVRVLDGGLAMWPFEKVE